MTSEDTIEWNIKLIIPFDLVRLFLYVTVNCNIWNYMILHELPLLFERLLYVILQSQTSYEICIKMHIMLGHLQP